MNGIAPLQRRLRSAVAALALAALGAIAGAAPAAALCNGENLIARMSEEARADLARRVAEVPYPEGNFWKAERPGSTVHVVGTIHLPDPRLDPLAQRAASLLDAADVLILEAAANDERRLKRLMAENPDMAFLNDGPTLIDLLGEEHWERLAERLRARGIPPFLGAKYRPWLMTLTLAVPACAMDAVIAGERGLDASLETAAQARGLPVKTLDDIDEVMALMTGGSLEEQVALLRLTLDTVGDEDAAMATTLDSYFAGRHRELWEFSRGLASDRSNPDAAGIFDRFEADLLESRNRDWEDRLPALVAGRNAVIAVGAAHLSGETGVLRALERMGYTLTRL